MIPMKNKEGATCNCDKEQVEIMQKNGWEVVTAGAEAPAEEAPAEEGEAKSGRAKK